MNLTTEGGNIATVETKRIVIPPTETLLLNNVEIVVNSSGGVEIRKLNPDYPFMMQHGRMHARTIRQLIESDKKASERIAAMKKRDRKSLIITILAALIGPLLLAAGIHIAKGL